jgi:hypothetical protein
MVKPVGSDPRRRSSVAAVGGPSCFVGVLHLGEYLALCGA